MNKARKTSLRNLAVILGETGNKLQSVCSDEKEYFESIPDNLKYSKAAKESRETIGKIQKISLLIEEAINGINDII